MTDEERWSFVFPAPDAVSENDVRGRHWAAVRDRLQPWKDAATLTAKVAVNAGRIPRDRPCRVKMVIPVKSRARRVDPHNFVGTVVKAVVDGMVIAGVWPDDNPDWVEVLEPYLDPGGTVAKVVLTPK